MKLLQMLYKPVSIVGGLLAGRLATKLFARIWALIDDEPPPTKGAPVEQATLRKTMAAAVLQGATFTATKVAIDRAGQRGFRHVFGVTPVPKSAKTDDE